MIKIAAHTGKHPATDATVVFLFEDKEKFSKQSAAIRKLYALPEKPFRSGAFTGKPGQTMSIFPPDAVHGQLFLVGLGKQSECSLERLRRAAAVGAKAAYGARAASAAFIEPEPDVLAATPIGKLRDLWLNVGTAFGEGIHLGLYRYEKYLSESKKTPGKLSSVLVVSAAASRGGQIARGLAFADIVCAGTNLARDLENAPGNEIFPATLADQAKKIGKQFGIKVDVFDERKIEALHMGGLLGVSRGSSRPPRFIVMEHNRRAASAGTIVLVGKGVTFDSGGISLKPSGNMAEMKLDMSGAAAVIATLQTAARLKLPLHCVGLIPATENLPSGSALKPGDILRHYNGKTSEVDNTDAEGRLILADALSYAARFDPSVVIDLATLTGACVVALGHHASGMLGNDEGIMQRLSEAGDRTYERVWPLPMFEEYEKQIKSDVADVKNVGGRWAGAITAALFLKNFIGDYRWVHLDIAGTAIMEEAQDYIPKGGSGVGVRLLIDFLRHWKRPS
jgi:leucyl aminopeptidase